MFVHLIPISSTSPTHHSIDTLSRGASLASHKSKALAPCAIPQTRSAFARRETASGFLNIANAATALEHFLETVMNRAEGIWVSDEPIRAFTVEIGMLVMEVTCEIPLPWDFVSWVAEKLLHRVSLGFVGTFKAMVEHMPSSKMVHVNLRRILDVALAA